MGKFADMMKEKERQEKRQVVGYVDGTTYIEKGVDKNASNASDSKNTKRVRTGKPRKRKSNNS